MKNQTKIRLYLAFALPFLVSISGCGSSGMSGTEVKTGDKVEIAISPYSQTIPLGQPATFNVTATGTDPLHYQWSENGNIVSGATSASFTTPDVMTSDNGSTFTVTVSNDLNSVTSSPATLTIGPRSPKPGDLRFKQVDAPSTSNQSTGSNVAFNFDANTFGSFPNATGSPLSLDNGDCVPGVPYDCGWAIDITSLPSGQSGLTAMYKSGEYDYFSSDVATSSTPNSVVTSLDFQPANDVYALAAIQQDNGSQFDMRHEVVSLSELQDTVAQDAASNRVVTALSFDAQGKVNLFSYGWQGDTTTVYQTSVVTVAPEKVADVATSLASQGYIITAFGGDFTNGFVIVGTKVQGDTMARPVIAATQDSPPAQPGWAEGYSPVAWVDYRPSGYAVIYEK